MVIHIEQPSITIKIEYSKQSRPKLLLTMADILNNPK